MRVLWSINIPLGEAAELMGIGSVATVSWLDYLSKEIRKTCDFAICFPTNEINEYQMVQGEGITFYAIPRKSKNGYEYEDKLTAYYQRVIRDFKPDVIQQWGTEFPNAWNLTQASELENMLEHTVVHIQGLISICSKEEHFYASLPEKVVKSKSFKEYFTGNNLVGLRRKMEKRGEYERLTIQKIHHVIGRTDFDKACTSLMNPRVQYHYNGEVLRTPFYENQWNFDSCEKYRVFMSQGGIPYKGMHYALWALEKVKETYPNVKLYITGKTLSIHAGLKERMRYSSYELYLAREIERLDLTDNVVFLGALNAQEMCEQYLKAHVFILPSAIDNSPNSLGEAMILGMPVVAADVGGVKNLCKRNEEGLLYQHDADYMLAGYIMEIFEESKEKTIKRGMAARKHALERFDPEKNELELLKIYEEISRV